MNIILLITAHCYLHWPRPYSLGSTYCHFTLHSIFLPLPLGSFITPPLGQWTWVWPKPLCLPTVPSTAQHIFTHGDLRLLSPPGYGKERIFSCPYPSRFSKESEPRVQVQPLRLKCSSLVTRILDCWHHFRDFHLSSHHCSALLWSTFFFHNTPHSDRCTTMGRPLAMPPRLCL